MKNDLNYFLDNLLELLDLEKKIDEKILYNIPLTEKEYFFHTYFIRPSFLIRQITKNRKESGK